MGIGEMARELGLAIGRTDEYKELKRAIGAVDEDRELVTLRNQLVELERGVAESVRAGNELPTEVAEEYETLFGRLQSSPIYQRFVASQANFDKVLGRVNETISAAIEEGGQSSIIIPS